MSCFESILFSSFINDFEMIPVTRVVIILVITVMHVIYSYIPETNYVSEAQSVAAVLYLKFELI